MRAPRNCNVTLTRQSVQNLIFKTRSSSYGTAQSDQ